MRNMMEGQRGLPRYLPTFAYESQKVRLWTLARFHAAQNFSQALSCAAVFL